MIMWELSEKVRFDLPAEMLRTTKKKVREVEDFHITGCIFFFMLMRVKSC